LDDGHDDPLLSTLSEAVEKRRDAQNALARQRDEAASRVRSLLAEAVAEEGLGGRISGPRPSEADANTEPSPPESPEGLPEDPAAQDSNEVQVSEPPAMTVEDAAPVESLESNDPSSPREEPVAPVQPPESSASPPAEEPPAEDLEDEISFEALLGDDEPAGADVAPPDEAKAELATDESMGAEASNDSLTEPDDIPEEATVETSAPDEVTITGPIAQDDEDLWGSLLAEEGEEGSFQPEAVT
jgi:hypothetical protein